MRIRRFSPKQKRVLRWWHREGDRERDAIICDGAVRSGKTICMGLSFFLWAMSSFEGEKFGLCGKTIVSLRRNLWSEVRGVLGSWGLAVQKKCHRTL